MGLNDGSLHQLVDALMYLAIKTELVCPSLKDTASLLAFFLVVNKDKVCPKLSDIMKLFIPHSNRGICDYPEGSPEASHYDRSLDFTICFANPSMARSTGRFYAVNVQLNCIYRLIFSVTAQLHAHRKRT